MALSQLAIWKLESPGESNRAQAHLARSHGWRVAGPLASEMRENIGLGTGPLSSGRC